MSDRRALVAELKRLAPPGGFADGVCENMVSFLFGPMERCDNPSTVLLSHACVHEHVSPPVPSCAECAGRLTHQSMYCNECTLGSESHECPVATSTTPIEIPDV